MARQLLFDRLELEQQIVAERPDQSQPAILLAAKFFDESSQDRKHGRLLAALFFREQRRQGLQPAGEHSSFESELLPVGMFREDVVEHRYDLLAAKVERAEFNATVVRNDF